MGLTGGTAAEARARFRSAYAEQRASEGRGAGGIEELMALPYLRSGPQAPQWAVRARSFDRLVEAIVKPLGRALQRPLRVLDLGAGNGWLCHRLMLLGHRAIALDVRVDDVDGLGAARHYASRLPRLFGRVAASFDAVPLPDATFDIAVFNASLHYAVDPRAALAEAARVVAPGGRVVVLDSPVYRREADGMAMVREKHRTASLHFGERASALLALPFIEFLTAERLREAGAPSGLEWRRLRVAYPLRYEIRPLVARLRGRRPPSRFDLWMAVRP